MTISKDDSMEPHVPTVGPAPSVPSAKVLSVTLSQDQPAPAPTSSAVGVQSAADALLAKMWATSGARFNAGRRLKVMHRWSLAATSALSAYVIVASAIPLIVPLGLSPRQTGLMNALLIGVAVFILVLTLLEASNSYELRSERLHESGTELSELRNYLEIRLKTGQLKPEDLLEVQRDYDSILRRFPVNHDPLDYWMYRIQYPGDSVMGGYKRLWTRVEYGCRPRVPYLILMILPAVALYLLAF